MQWRLGLVIIAYAASAYSSGLRALPSPRRGFGEGSGHGEGTRLDGREHAERLQGGVRPVMAGRESCFLPSPRSRTVCALGTGKLIIRQRESP